VAGWWKSPDYPTVGSSLHHSVECEALIVIGPPIRVHNCRVAIDLDSKWQCWRQFRQDRVNELGAQVVGERICSDVIPLGPCDSRVIIWNGGQSQARADRRAAADKTKIVG
jgi:hypothetical protein